MRAPLNGVGRGSDRCVNYVQFVWLLCFWHFFSSYDGDFFIFLLFSTVLLFACARASPSAAAESEDWLTRPRTLAIAQFALFFVRVCVLEQRAGEWESVRILLCSCSCVWVESAVGVRAQTFDAHCTLNEICNGSVLSNWIAQMLTTTAHINYIRYAKLCARRSTSAIACCRLQLNDAHKCPKTCAGCCFWCCRCRWWLRQTVSALQEEESQLTFCL